jgi:hypothetical protein
MLEAEWNVRVPVPGLLSELQHILGPEPLKMNAHTLVLDVVVQAHRTPPIPAAAMPDSVVPITLPVARVGAEWFRSVTCKVVVLS